MDPKTLGVAFLVATLAAETMIKWEGGFPHTHMHLELPINNSRIGVSIYRIPYNQFINSKSIYGLGWNSN